MAGVPGDLAQFASALLHELGGAKSLARLMRARDYSPVPALGPEIHPNVWVVAMSADRHGMWLLDSGGDSHLIKWEKQDGETSDSGRT